MKWRLLRAPIEREDDIVAVRQRARVVAERLGLSRQEQTGLATAVSEIARNAYGYAGGGHAEFGIDEIDGGQVLVIRITDTGKGIVDLGAILSERYVSSTGMGVGIVGARRLVDKFDIRSTPGKGSVVTLGKCLTAKRPDLTGADVSALADMLVRERDENPQEAIRHQNRELMQSLSDLAEREAELREARATLERRVAERTSELAAVNERLKVEAAERERVQAALRQAQKMEAVGQLTGGIAHDFNNLLTGIVGSLDMLQNRIAKGRTDGVKRYVETAMTSANRAAALTNRLLAFSRPQPLAPKSTDANAVIRGMEELLRRTITDAIAFRVSAALDLWPTMCDAHELENAVLNLCINARDAMPDGGALIIGTHNEYLDAAYVAQQPTATVGDHIRLTIADNGTGMPPAVVARVFEPFFTTKPVGKGTGLGLSMIYSFARQSGGHCRIDSEEGRGTAVNLYLPRHKANPENDAWTSSTAPSLVTMPLGVAVSILLVEQNPMVRELTIEVLTENGHHVIVAEDGEGAMRRLSGDINVDLIVTDIGLPGGMTGRRLAERARELRPALKVLFITGYAGEAEAVSVMGVSGVEVLTKPFHVRTLAERIEAMLSDNS